MTTAVELAKTCLADLGPGETFTIGRLRDTADRRVWADGRGNNRERTAMAVWVLR